MKEIVKSDPAKPVGNAIRRVREQAFEEFHDEKDFYTNLICALGTDAAL